MTARRVIGFDLPKAEFRIELDRRWKLEELHQYTKNFEQAYFAYFAIYSISPEGGSDQRVFRSVSNNLKSYPWRGGASVVGFYYGLKRIMGRRNIPEVKAIKYASPGYLDLFLHLPVAVQVAASVTSIATSIGVCNQVYNSIYRGLKERKLNEIAVERAELDLEREKLAFVQESTKQMADILQVDDVDRLVEMSGNELRALKVLLSVFRRVRTLSRYQNEKKAYLLTNRIDK